MSALIIINCVLALLVLGAAVCRLGNTKAYGKDLRSNLNWHAWVLSHALLGTGCFGYICAKLSDIEPQLSFTSILAGLAILLLFPWKRREGDRT